VRKLAQAQFLCSSFQVSERRAWRVLKLKRLVYYYRSRKDPQTELRVRLKHLAAARVRYSHERLHTLLRREGWQINLKRV
jgi:putative transposase